MTPLVMALVVVRLTLGISPLSFLTVPTDLFPSLHASSGHQGCHPCWTPYALAVSSNPSPIRGPPLSPLYAKPTSIILFSVPLQLCFSIHSGGQVLSRGGQIGHSSRDMPVR